MTFAHELEITCALDPLVRAPGEMDDPYEGLEAASLYQALGVGVAAFVPGCLLVRLGGRLTSGSRAR